MNILKISIWQDVETKVIVIEQNSFITYFTRFSCNSGVKQKNGTTTVRYARLNKVCQCNSAASSIGKSSPLHSDSVKEAGFHKLLQEELHVTELGVLDAK